jgi:hypothetical protein
MFQVRPRSLVADLVLWGLATDLLETGLAVEHTARSALPHKAYANARLAFETAQNLLVLATHEEYEIAGAIAWVYFEWKDASWRAAAERKKAPDGLGPTEDQWLERRVDQVANVWSKVAKDQGGRLREALATVRRDRKKKPDNWLHENMTQRQHRAYVLFAAQNGKGSPADTAELNQAMYKVLCRETHAGPRFDSFWNHSRPR